MNHLFDPCEPVSALSHLVGALVAIALTPVLLRRHRGHASHQAAVGVYSFSLVFLLAMSGIYHTQYHGNVGRTTFQQFDHAGIWLLIAGSFTPPHVILFRGRWRWLPLVIVWTGALIGMSLKLFLPIDAIPKPLSFMMYFALGGFGAVSGIKLMQRYGVAVARVLLACGGIYGAGAVFFFALRLPGEIVPGFGYHELWHLSVVGGAACHWIFVYQIGALEPMPEPVKLELPVAPPVTLPSPGLAPAPGLARVQ